ncbi:DBF4-type zinc finger-containing protein 2 homolog [Onychomys torridus]|uniref:DBF4-type zinc finger-containing protein 2 homolog n=1 Tax=Onychomys torridus TaxID=38674 RepID=UPI00167FAF97|nr:DBF4-type zinc finger-containing protein 2 homolog [Onychomys torridus]
MKLKVALLFVRLQTTSPLAVGGRSSSQPRSLIPLPPAVAEPVHFFTEKGDQKWPVWAVAKQQNWPLSSWGLHRRDPIAERRLLASPALLRALWPFYRDSSELEQVKQVTVCPRSPGTAARALPFHKPLSAPGAQALLPMPCPPTSHCLPQEPRHCCPCPALPQATVCPRSPGTAARALPFHKPLSAPGAQALLPVPCPPTSHCLPQEPRHCCPCPALPQATVCPRSPGTAARALPSHKPLSAPGAQALLPVPCPSTSHCLPLPQEPRHCCPCPALPQATVCPRSPGTAARALPSHKPTCLGP